MFLYIVYKNKNISFKYYLENRAVIDKLPLIIHVDRIPQNWYTGSYNCSSVNELLMDEDKGPRDIGWTSSKGWTNKQNLQRAIQYPLMFISGKDSYYLTFPQQTHIMQNLFSQYYVDVMASTTHTTKT